MAGHSPSGFFGRQQNSWFHLLQQVFQVLEQQNRPRPSHYCCYVLFLKCGCLVTPQSIFLKVLVIIKMFSGKNETSLNVLFAQQWFSSWNSAMQAIFAQSLSYGGVMNTDLNWGKWGLQFGCCCQVLVGRSLRRRYVLTGWVGANTFWHRARFGFFH